MANMSKETLLKSYLDCSTRLNGHLNKLKSIPSQNFSSLDQKRMATLRNGVDALKILAQKLNMFSEEDAPDVAAEKVAVEKAIETAEELEGGQTGKSQVGEPGDVDEMVKKLFEAEELTETNDFKPQAGAPEGAKDMNDWTPEINSLDDMNEAFSRYVAQDYYRRATGREDFALHIGTNSISTNPKDYWKALKSLGKKTNKNIDKINDNLTEHYPSVAGGIKVASQGALIGAALDIAISSLKRNLSYDEYKKNCELEGIEPIEKSKYTLGSLEDLKKSIIRGGSLGAIGNLALTGGKGAMEGLNKNLAQANFALTPEDFQDASKMAEEQSLNIMKQSFSLGKGYYPGNNNAIFLDWLKDNAEEYFSLRADIYNQIIEEANNFALNPTIGDALKGAGIGGAIGGLSATAVAAIKKNKSYDMYKAEAEKKGEKPLSRVAYLAKSKEVQKAGLAGLGAGAGLGAAIGGSGLGRKGVGAVKKLLGKKENENKNNVLPPTNKALEEAQNLEDDTKWSGRKHYDESEADKALSNLATSKLREEYNKEKAKGRFQNLSFEQYKDFKIKQIQKQTNANTLGNLYETGTKSHKNQAGIDAKNYKNSRIEKAKNLIKQGRFNSEVKNIADDSFKNFIETQSKMLKGASPSLRKSIINNTLKRIGELEAKVIRFFFSQYGYYPKHSYDILFQNFCYDLVRNGQLEFKDLAAINFNFPQYQKDFAINKATVATGIAGTVVGGIGGKLLANKKIKEEEKRLGRPLTQEERSKITKRFVVGGAAGLGLAGAGAAHGIQHAAGKGNATAQNIVNKVVGASNKVQSLYGQGKDKVGEIKRKGERLYKKHVHGLSYDTQDQLELNEKQDNALFQQALQKRTKGEPLSADEALSLRSGYQRIREYGLARKAMMLGGAGMAYKFLAPMVQQAISRGADVDESQVQAMVQKMQAEGKSEDEIREAVQGYLQAAFFSYAQGFHKYY